MIVSGLQTAIVWEEPRANFSVARTMANRAVMDGARLIALPEMFATGFSMDSEKVAAFADETRSFLSGLAMDLGVIVLGGYAEPGEPLPFNACSIYSETGEELLHYRKIHPFTLAGEQDHYSGGDRIETAEIDGVRVTPVICYDLRFPELFRAAAERTDLFVVVANWPAKRSDAWSTLLRARAMENQAYVLGVNRVGTGAGEPHSGDSALFEPFGHPLAEATGVPAIVTGEVDPEAVRSARDHFSFLGDRRPEIYDQL